MNCDNNRTQSKQQTLHSNSAHSNTEHNTEQTSTFLVLAVEENQDWVTNKLTASRQHRRYSNQQRATQAHAGHSKPAVLKLLLVMAVFLVARNCGTLGTYIGNTGGEVETCTCEGSVL
jgi:hypothetical protein